MTSLNFATINNLQRALNQTSTAQNVISQNIANIDTPNYKAKKVMFNDTLQSSMKAIRTNSKHFDFSTGNDTKVVTDNRTSIQNNGNNVDMDQQMTELAKTQLQYQTYAEAVSRQFNKWNIVLGGGR